MERSSNQKCLLHKKPILEKSLVINLGCAKNLVETEKLCALLAQNGILLSSPDDTDYDAVWINTCCFIQAARDEALEVISKYTKRDNLSVIIFGCFAQKYAEQLIKNFPNAIVFEGFQPISDICNSWFSPSSNLSLRSLSNPYSAYLKISEGCNRNCSFCLIPSIKGNYHSYSLEELTKEAVQLAKAYPVKELVLVAQDTNSYGIDQAKSNVNLLNLVKSLSDTSLFQWIRVMYLFPSFTYEFLDQMLSIPGVVPYIDVPLQHVAPEILRSMNRPTNIESIVEVLKSVRKKYHNLAIRSTFIVGYPGETEQNFEDLCNFIKTFRFQRAGFFSYSDEIDSSSYHLKEKIDIKTKEDRLQAIYRLQEDITYFENMQWEGKNLPVLLEGWRGINRTFYGRSLWDAPEIDHEISVSVDSPRQAKHEGDILSVQISRVTRTSITGHLI